MLVCTDESDDPNVDVEETSEQTPHKKDKKFVFIHGGKYSRRTIIVQDTSPFSSRYCHKIESVLR